MVQIFIILYDQPSPYLPLPCLSSFLLIFLYDFFIETEETVFREEFWKRGKGTFQSG